MKFIFFFIYLLALFNQTEPNRVRIWTRIPKFYVYDRVKYFLDAHHINNCFYFKETNYKLMLKCKRENEIVDINIDINKFKKKIRTNKEIYTFSV